MKGLALGAIIAIIVACGGRQSLMPDWQIRQHKLDEMDRRLGEIRQWRHEHGMGIEPTSVDISFVRSKTVPQAKNVCPADHVVPKSCSDICVLSDDICDNAEAICAIADELGKDDKEAQDRCASGKASCREAMKHCCECQPEPAP
jgi:hypothetical protein